MSVRATFQTIPRTVVDGYLRVLRAPLVVVERAAHQQDNEQWPPTLAFDSFDAGVRAVVGAALRDSTLLEQGRVLQAKVAQLRRAAELTTLAEQEQQQAEARLEERRDQVATQREVAERQAEQRKQDVERQAEQQERAVKQKAARKAAAARQAKAAQETAIERQERVAKSAALNAESRALRVTEQALEADETVEVIAETLDGTKEARQTG